MTAEGLQVVGVVLQTLSVVAAVVAASVALRIAVGNRRASLRQSHLMFELDAAVRLAENLSRGGTATGSDAATLERQRMGGEAWAMAAALGPSRLPHYWVHKFESEDEVRKQLEDESLDEWWRHAAEAHLAVFGILRDIAAEERHGGARRQFRRRR